MRPTPVYTLDQLRAVVLEERLACAQLCKEIADELREAGKPFDAALDCELIIKARSYMTKNVMAPPAAKRNRFLSFLNSVLPKKRIRVEIRFVSYATAERLILQGWELATEEDRNRTVGYVYIERVEYRDRFV